MTFPFFNWPRQPEVLDIVGYCSSRVVVVVVVVMVVVAAVVVRRRDRNDNVDRMDGVGRRRPKRTTTVSTTTRPIDGDVP
jgi:heme/copper-type cytochrome/quinol oxidase subunit 2